MNGCYASLHNLDGPEHGLERFRRRVLWSAKHAIVLLSSVSHGGVDVLPCAWDVFVPFPFAPDGS